MVDTSSSVMQQYTVGIQSVALQVVTPAVTSVLSSGQQTSLASLTCSSGDDHKHVVCNEDDVYNPHKRTVTSCEVNRLELAYPFIHCVVSR
jgi:hypothetical protein